MFCLILLVFLLDILSFCNKQLCNRLLTFTYHFCLDSLLLDVIYTRLTLPVMEIQQSAEQHCLIGSNWTAICEAVYWFSVWPTVREFTHDLSLLRWKIPVRNTGVLEKKTNLLGGDATDCSLSEAFLSAVWRCAIPLYFFHAITHAHRGAMKGKCGIWSNFLNNSTCTFYIEISFHWVRNLFKVF